MFNSKPHLQIGKGDDPKLRMKDSGLMELTTTPPPSPSVPGLGEGVGRCLLAMPKYNLGLGRIPVPGGSRLREDARPLPETE